ncbi:hypothetical protein Q5P01_004861 [Channa striata]|uniref:Syndecan/Neurexin domain-containing protein n=1 Tax=Channa striata TaxID=64152 RepID=A0AA88NI28_CHASR|nr:hypothetical protein Q5P01_004861 [Channa striata]
MTVTRTALFFLALGFLHPVRMSFTALLEDVEGSGYDLDSSGSGLGDLSEQREISNMEVYPSSQDLTAETTHWPANDSEYFVSVTNNINFLENKQVFTAVIAGGVTGMILAAILTALLIWKWQDKENGGYIIGQRVHRDAVIF